MKEIEGIYNDILKNHIHRLLGTKSTFSDVLDRQGRQLLGTKFKGVYASDRIPLLTDLHPYAILNLDRTGLPGSHWIAVAKKKDSKELLVYDSFGRSSRKIIPKIFSSGNGKIIDTEYDPEQKVNEDDCGARSMTFLVVLNTFGYEKAKML